jgi:hypothetical protein
MTTENKHAYFILELPILKSQREERYFKELQDAVELVLAGMSSEKEPYQFLKQNQSQLLIFFETKVRKRKGQLIKLCQTNFLTSQLYETKGISKTVFWKEIERLKKEDHYQLWQAPNTERKKYHYTGLDLQFFNDKNNWYPWQREIYHLIFKEDATIQKPDPRQIIGLVDPIGNSGKSSFFKWIFYHYPNQVGRMIAGLSSELRANLIKLGPKKIYLLDVTKRQSKQETEELLAVIEDLKTGIVTYYNSNLLTVETLLMEPPHIIISFHDRVNHLWLTKEKWQIYELNINKTLEKINPFLENEEKERIDELKTNPTLEKVNPFLENEEVRDPLGSNHQLFNYA